MVDMHTDVRPSKHASQLQTAVRLGCRPEQLLPLLPPAPHLRAGTFGSPHSFRPCRRGPVMGHSGGTSSEAELAVRRSTSMPCGP